MKVDIINKEGQSTGRSLELPDEIFGIEPNEHCMYLDVKQYNAHQRQGTHKAKERGEIAGSTRKIKRQKGTGTARAGSIKSPIFRGGGRIFGPRPRNYVQRLNKKVKKLARKSALSAKMNSGKIKVIEDLVMESPRTKDFLSVLNRVSPVSKRLVVTDTMDKNLHLSARNLPKDAVVTASQLNTYSILNCNDLILTEKSVEVLKELLA